MNKRAVDIIDNLLMLKEEAEQRAWLQSILDRSPPAGFTQILLEKGVTLTDLRDVVRDKLSRPLETKEARVKRLAADVMAIDPKTTRITRAMMWKVLDMLCLIEPDFERGTPDSRDAYYARVMKIAGPAVQHGYAIIRAYGEQMGLPLELMQRDFYSYTNHPKYLQNNTTITTVRHALSFNWDGIGNWRD